MGLSLTAATAAGVTARGRALALVHQQGLPAANICPGPRACHTVRGMCCYVCALTGVGAIAAVACTYASRIDAASSTAIHCTSITGVVDGPWTVYGLCKGLDVRPLIAVCCWECAFSTVRQGQLAPAVSLRQHQECASSWVDKLASKAEAT